VLLRILVVADAPALARRLERLLAAGVDAVVTASGEGEGLWEALARDTFDLVVVSDRVLPEPNASVVTTLRRLPDRPDVVVLQEHEDAQRRAALLSAGCLAVLNVRLADALLGDALQAFVRRRLEATQGRFRGDEERAEPSKLADFSSQSPAMRRLIDTVRRVVEADSSLLILGETGVGKEWLARAIHEEGPRKAATFLALNCAAVPESLLESELFGHERGAFTGAVRSRRGTFELAHGGTLFLDEIADMSPHLQAKLLRVLEERRITRVGAERSVAVDVRIIAATNRDLEVAIREREFRQDLFFRLGVVTLTIPPLRERRDDIEPLVMAYLDRFGTQLGRPIRNVRSEVLEALVSYEWPGNVRELINVVERAVLLCRGDTLTLEEIPDTIAARPDSSGRRPAYPMPQVEAWLDLPLRKVRGLTLGATERAYLDGLLRATGGRVGETARRAGIDPRSLYDKMRRHGLRKEDYRAGTISSAVSRRNR
jgi:two-component system response regulator AtoC